LKADTINRSIEEERRLQLLVRDLKVLKNRMQREGIFREMKLRSHYEKPSEKKTREKAEAIRRNADSLVMLPATNQAPDAIVPQSHVERVVSSLGRLV
jgi:ribosomal protein S21